MTPGELRTIGERLYGPRWQTKLARALPVNARSVRRWLSGERNIRPVIAARIKRLPGPDRISCGLQYSPQIARRRSLAAVTAREIGPKVVQKTM